MVSGVQASRLPHDWLLARIPPVRVGWRAVSRSKEMSEGDKDMSRRDATDEALSGWNYDDLMSILRAIAYNLAEIADQLEGLNGRVDNLTDSDVV